MSIPFVARGLAAAFLASDWTVAGMVARGEEALDKKTPWLEGAAHESLAAFPAAPLHDPEPLVALLARPLRRRADAGQRVPATIRRFFFAPSIMKPGHRFPVPELPTA